MKTRIVSVSPRPTRFQRGIAAIEFALLMPVLLVFLTLPIFFARVYWHYTIAQKAGQDAVHYLSTVPKSEMLSRNSAREAGEFAKQIIQRQLADIAPGLEITELDIRCNTGLCGNLLGGQTPDTVHVQFSITLYDPFNQVDLGWYGLQINVDYTMDYVGN